MFRALRFHLTALLLVVAAPALAQYNSTAGKNAPAPEAVQVRSVDALGRVSVHQELRAPARDSFGNAAGNNHDLAVDGAFDGQTVAVLQFYTEENFKFEQPKQALREKGFSVYRWVNQAPSPEQLEQALGKACQLWIISDSTRHLNAAHLAVIKRYFEAGHGVYIWGDNEPYYADANAVAETLFGAQMLGNLMGNQTVGLMKAQGTPGILQDHLLSTGLEHIYEGITIATIQPNPQLRPLIYGSAGNLVTAFFDHQGRRAILDGGFTRLYCNWDTAGTGRYVKNAAAWLANVERFGDRVVSEKFRQRPAGTPLN